MAHNWTEKDAANQFKEAILTLKKLRLVWEHGNFNVWPEIVRTLGDIAVGEPIATSATCHT